MPKAIKFTDELQHAIVGHLLTNPALWIQAGELGVEADWIVDLRLRSVYDRACEFRSRYSRPPTPTELVQWVKAIPGVDENEQQGFSLGVKKAVAAANAIGYDLAHAALYDWKRKHLIYTQTLSISQLYNEQKIEEASEVLQKTADDLGLLTRMSGVMPDRMEPSPDRLARERESRHNLKDRVLSYGISFLDDMLVGIAPDDFILLGARTGVGKTELTRLIATDVAERQGKRVAAFFLEATEGEIEQRTKYSLLASRYQEYMGGHSDINVIDYPEWKLRRPGSEVLDAFEKDVEEEYCRRFKNLHTYYRSRGSFGLNELDRELNKLYGQVDLVVLDHLHYLDLDSDKENAEMKAIAKRLRDFSVSPGGAPVIAVSHLRKGAIKNLVPTIDDYHGASDLSKIATTAIMLAPCHGFVATDFEEGYHPTFFRVLKSRLAGARARFVGVCYYNQITRSYDHKYSLGSINYSETRWTPIDPSSLPAWAPADRVVTDVSEVES